MTLRKGKCSRRVCKAWLNDHIETESEALASEPSLSSFVVPGCPSGRAEGICGWTPGARTGALADSPEQRLEQGRDRGSGRRTPGKRERKGQSVLGRSEPWREGTEGMESQEGHGD